MSYKLTCVSGFWEANNKNTGSDSNKYYEWFKISLQINCPYIFFGDSKTIEKIKLIRKELPTHYIEHNMENFFTNKEEYLNKFVIEKGHITSKEVNMIYHEKIFMVKKAIEINPFNSEYFHWIDAGICAYRRKLPPQMQFPKENIYNLLPKNKFIFSASNPYLSENQFKQLNINENYKHYIAATSFLIHKNIINEIVDKYIYYLKNREKIYDDQHIYTDIQRKLPHLFYSLYDTNKLLDSKGYGYVTQYLFGEINDNKIDLLNNNLKFKLKYI